MSSVSLLVVQGPDQGKRFDLDGESLIIGRGTASAICLSDSEISRDHARLRSLDGQWSIADLGSSNGTFVNGRGVQNRPLVHGDQIQVGRTVLVLRASQPEAAESASHVEIVGSVEPPEPSRILATLPPDQSLLDRNLMDWTISRRAAANLQILYQVSEELTRPNRRLEELLQRLLNIGLPAVGADRGCMLIADARTDRIEPRVVVRRPGIPEDERFPVSRSIVHYVIQNGIAVRTSDARKDERFAPGESILASGIREAICAPMQGRFELLGVIYVDITTSSPEWIERGGVARFDDDHLALLAAVGRQAASAIESNRYQQALLESERLATVGRTTAVLSHHIKNILQGVRGGSYLIDMGLKESDNTKIQKGWKIVERNQDRIYRLVMDMLSFSKDRRPSLAPASINDVVTEVCDLMQPQADETRVRLDRRLGEVPASAFDSEGIHRAVLNLVVNAIEALDGVAEACVTVTTRYDATADRIVVEVADNGPGIAAEELPRLFNIFESTKGARGTGLGLAVSRKILKEHGGDLTVESEPGRGAKFTLSWPRLDSPTLAG